MLVYRSLPKTAGLLVAALALIVASAFTAWANRPGTPSNNLILFVIGAFGVLFFTFGLVRVGQQLVNRGPVIEVSAEGVRDVRMSPQVVPWHVVRGVEQLVVQQQRFLVVQVEEQFEKQYLAGGKRMLQRINRQAGFAGINIGMTGLRVSIGELQEAIVQHWRAATPGNDRW